MNMDGMEQANPTVPPEAGAVAPEAVTVPPETASVPPEAGAETAAGAASPQPITITLGEGVELHPGLEKMFKDVCAAQNMTSAQAQAIVDLNGRFAAEAQRLYLEQGEAALEQRFGADTGMVKDKALKAFAALDRKMEGRLSAGPAGKQIASDPLAVEALYLIHRMISEDALGGGTAAGGEDRPMSDRDFLQQVFDNQQQGAGSTI